jgi:IPT/TIG domain
MRTPHRLTLMLLLTLPLLASACKSDPSGPELPPLEAVVAEGDGQFGTLGQILPTRLRVLVRAVGSGKPQKEAAVLWTVEGGDASFTTSAATITDSTGSAFATVRLGGTAGEVVIRATVTERQTAQATFHLFAVDRPVLESLSSGEADVGDTLTLTGLNFSPTPGQNVVLFSGVRGAVVTSSPTQLSVEVPRCIPTRTVDVSVQLGALASESRTLSVVGNGEKTLLAPGEVLDITDAAGLQCVRLAGGGDVRYLAIVSSASTVGAAQHGFQLTGLADAGSSRVSAPVAARAARSATSSGGGGVPSAAWRWERTLRRWEAELVRDRPVLSGSARTSRPARVPAVGEERTFNVLKSGGGFDQVTAVAKFVGTHAALYLDVAAPSGGFTQEDLEAFAARFDDVSFPVVTSNFGSPSDLDGNERIVMLFTPAVNRLTPRGAAGFVGGFFFGVDLLRNSEGSNDGEVFYALVPDPTGMFSDPRPKSKVLEVTPAVLAHEFQHMVHFNERILKLEATTEALWLSEGLAQMAEEMVARSYESVGDLVSASLFRSGDAGRARRYMEDPGAVSLIVGTGQGTLEERGAGWLHVLYLTAQSGESVLGKLTRTTRTGVDNVTQTMGLAWPELTSNWWSALYLDPLGSDDPRLEFPGVSLANVLREGPFPLSPEEVGSGDFTRSGSLWSSSARYYIVQPAPQGSVALRLGGEAGSGSAPESALRMRLIRIP